MLVMRFGLMVAALGFLVATVGSVRAGYPIEMALVRGLLSFMALSFVGYLGELVIATSGAPNAATAGGDGRGGSDGTQIGSADDQVEGPRQRATEPARLPAPSDGREAA